MGNATFAVRESVQQLHVTHARPGDTLTVLDGQRSIVATGTVDALGSLVFRTLVPGAGYTVRDAGTTPVEERKNLLVGSIESSKPTPGAYALQKLVKGFQYLTMRDGTTLSAYVTFPGPPEDGPFPTVVNYSGYAPSKPGEPLAGNQYASLCPALPILCDAPSDPSALVDLHHAARLRAHHGVQYHLADDEERRRLEAGRAHARREIGERAGHGALIGERGVRDDRRGCLARAARRDQRGARRLEPTEAHVEDDGAGDGEGNAGRQRA